MTHEQLEAQVSLYAHVFGRPMTGRAHTTAALRRAFQPWEPRPGKSVAAITVGTSAHELLEQCGARVVTFADARRVLDPFALPRPVDVPVGAGDRITLPPADAAVSSCGRPVHAHRVNLPLTGVAR